ncbi:MAG: FecR domain-containing protein [Deltaproteobacteria bacterium]|nr:FecR domain-containing protein [Deltaproteobacteria bacterium]
MMTRHDCKIASRIWEDTIAEKRLPEALESFVADHLEHCTPCRTEDEWISLYQTKAPELLVPPLDELKRRRRIEDALARAAAETSAAVGTGKTKSPFSAKRVLFGAVAAVVVMGLVLGVLIEDGAAPELARNEEIFQVTKAGPYHGEFLEVSGDVTVRRVPVSQGAALIPGSRISVADGRAVLGLTTKIHLNIESNSEIEVSELGAKGAEITLNFGGVRARVDPTLKPLSFTVSTRAGRVTVSGTEFVVRDEKDRVWVGVFEGSVRVTEPGRRPRAVSAGFGTVLDGTEILTALDEAEAGEVSHEEASHEEVSHLDAKTPVSNRTIPSEPPAPENLLRRAHALRLEGNWRGAAKIYQRLCREYPNSNEAVTSLVSLGQIQLRNLSKPKAALSSFDRYLKKGGQKDLAREALDGKAQAYRAMGKRTQEISVLEQVIAQFPSSVQARRAKERLQTLNADNAL